MVKRTKLTVIAVFFALSLVIPGMSLAVDPGDVQIHGFVSQGYLYTGDNEFLADTEAGSFEFNEAGVNFTAEPVEKLRVGVQLFARDLGDIDNNRVDLDWAFADYRLRNELGVRIGRVKVPNGLSMDSMDLDMSRTTVFLPLSCYEPRYRAIMFAANGVNFYGAIKLGPLGGLDYSAIVGANSFPKEAMEGMFQGMMGVESISLRLLYGGRLIWNTPLKGLLFGGSYFIPEGFKAKGSVLPQLTAPIPQLGGMSIYPAGTKITFKSEKAEYYYVFTQFNRGKFTFTGEFDQIKFDAKVETDEPFDPFVGALTGFSGIPDTLQSLSKGWYAQADYQFLDWLTAAVTYGEYRFEQHDPKKKDWDPDWTGYQNDATVSLRFDVNSNWNIKLETHFITGAALVISSDTSTVPEGLEKYWNLYVVKTSFYF